MTLTWQGMAAGAFAAGVGALVAIAATGGFAPAPDRGETIRAYLLDHPEVIPEALERLEQKQTAQVIAANARAIEQPFPGAVAGNPRGDVTLVEYFDYACGYCRASVADVDRLVAGDPGLKVVFKEWPILSAASDPAARLSLAAAQAGKFAAFHHALYAAGPLDGAKLEQVAARFGIDPAAARAPAIGREIDTNMAVAHALHLTGTPTFIVGDQALEGAVGYAALKQAIAQARAAQRGA